MSQIAPTSTIAVGDRFEHPYEPDISWRPGAGQTGEDAPGQPCQVIELQGARVVFRHLVDGSLWGFGSAPTADVENAKRLPRS